MKTLSAATNQARMTLVLEFLFISTFSENIMIYYMKCHQAGLRLAFLFLFISAFSENIIIN